MKLPSNHRHASLRKRFQQNQEDCAYHILALLPTLGNAILEEMDVERITLQLQQSRAAAYQSTSSPLSAAHLQPHAHSGKLSESMISEATSATTSDLAEDGFQLSHSNSYSLPSQAPRPKPPSQFQLPPRSLASPSVAGPSFDTSGLQSSSGGLDWVTEFQAQQAQLANARLITGTVDGSPTSSAEAGLSDSGVSGSYITEGTESDLSVEGSVAESGVVSDLFMVSLKTSDSLCITEYIPNVRWWTCQHLNRHLRVNRQNSYHHKPRRHPKPSDVCH